MSNSGSESESSRVIRFSDIMTIRKLYQNSVLKLPAASKARYQPNARLLDQISFIQADLTKLEVDAIVNAANSSLLGGGGVDGAIHRAAGPRLLDECRMLNGCETGSSKITKGYNLPARHVIHTVGPIYSARQAEHKAAQLASCYRTSLELAVSNRLKHIAFPCISTGIYGYPIVEATHVALQEVRKFCESRAGPTLDRIIFVVWLDKDKKVYEELIPEYFPPASEERQEAVEA